MVRRHTRSSNGMGHNDHTLPLTQNGCRITERANTEFGGAGGTVFVYIGSGSGSAGVITDPAATSALEQYIDAAVKPDYIQNFMDDDLTSLKTKIDVSHNTIIQAITTYAENNASVYLANFALSTIGVVHKAYLISRTHADLVVQYDNLHAECQDFLRDKNVNAAALMGEIEVKATFDVRYIMYIQKYGIPPMGVFDPVKLAEFL